MPFAPTVPVVLGVSAGPLALALSAGVIVAFNPCGFAMLPAYVSYFVGKSAADAERPLAQRLVRASLVGGVVTLGFVTVFGIVGLLATQIFSTINSAVPFISIVVGLLLAVLGVTMLRGYEPKLSFLKVGQISEGRGLRSLYVFGLSYAVVSLSCGFAGFSGVVVSTLRYESLFGAATTYLTFSLGMGLVLMTLTLAAAMAQQAVARTLRRALPYVNRVSGAFLVIAGLYVAYYGWSSYRLRQSGSTPGGPVPIVERWSGSISEWLIARSTTSLVIAVAAVVAVIGGAVLVSRRRSGPTSPNSTNLTPKEQT
jgi:cytochrome c-type biogenesis protein